MPGTRTTASAALGMLLALAAGAGSALGHGADHDHGAPAGAPAEAGAALVQVTLADEVLTDADGRAVPFRSEAVGGDIVAISFIYTSCTTVCPIVSAIFAAVQEQLDGRLGRDVRLISLSVDPATDVPGRLKQYAQQFGAGPGWRFLTGDPAAVGRVLAGLGAYTPRPEDHAPMILVGDAERGLWRRLYGFPAPEDVVGELDRLAAFRDGQDSQ